MNTILAIGTLIFSGFLLGEAAKKVKLPKISGYIFAGILLNPALFGIIPKTFVENTDPLLSLALSVITFSIGGALSYAKIKSTGKTILWLTVFESLSAFFFVFIFTFLILGYLLNIFDSMNTTLAVSLILASLAAPTDPSATLAVIHEYRAKGKVSSSMLEIAAFDDMAGIIIYTITIAFAAMVIGNADLQIAGVFTELGRNIGGALLTGFITGLIFKYVNKLFSKENEGSLIVLTLGMVFLCYGISDCFGFEALLATMAMGAMVVNFNPFSDKIFNLIERYTDELVFVIFFTLSGIHLQLSSISGSFIIIVIYIVGRAIGKYSGVYSGATLLKTYPSVRKYTAGGLLPQGGIVIGLALLLLKEPAFNNIAPKIVGIVIGAALVYEILGPVFSKFMLKKAGEIEG